MLMTRSNAPESEAMTLEETEVFEAARQAAAHLRRSHEKWVDIGRAVILARDMANRRGGSTRMIRRIIEQQGLGTVVTGPDVSRLLRIMPQIEEVTAWRATLTDRQRIDFASPTTILRRCPAFRNPPAPSGEERMTLAERDRQQLAAAIEENHELRRQLDQRQDGDTFDYRTTPAKQMAKTIIGNLQPYRGKGRDFLREVGAELERLEAEARRRPR